ncbi:rhomboid-like protein [Antrihabitans cavernicola]|uniref:Rhomboid family intramembrane serine protease n=1 Tax=Antrihabitans cavernicola TaxID=2495913 RepID=A0A5A7S8A0_9NOCA|nr:rhomboid-like protein [Spelaeibacter cavernicola]KAA0021704.1 hypothetical protein FOY51_17615 [Spelaeibacter cavernicola]
MIEAVRALYRPVRNYFVAAPATLVYLFSLLVNWVTLRGADQRVTHRLIVSASTNLDNMRKEPLQVLIASAFWSDSTAFPWLLILEFLVVLAAAERALGTRRAIAIFAAGHVGATLITVTGIAYAVKHEMIPERIARTSDVGTSYGFFAVTAAFVSTMPKVPRVVLSAGLVIYLVIAAWRGQGFTDYGHLAALAIGFSAYPVGRLAVRLFRRRSTEAVHTVEAVG